jgi:hypothetical protein
MRMVHRVATTSREDGRSAPAITLRWRRRTFCCRKWSLGVGFVADEH